MLVSCRVSEPEPVLTFDELIELAGSAATDAERYDWYLQMADDVSGDPTLQQEWEDLRVFMDQWTNGRATYWEPGDQSMAGEGGYLAGFFVQLALPGLTSFPSVIRENSPLYPIWAMYRGRMLIWWAIEMGTLTEAYYEEGRTLLTLSREAFPNNPVLPAYLEAPVPWTLDLEVPESAPDWAVAQRELLEKLSHIIAFWVDERQAPDGQFGGGWETM